MTRVRTALASGVKVLLVVLAGVASIATSANRPRPVYPVAPGGWREVITVVDPSGAVDTSAATLVTDLSFGEEIPTRVWAEPTGEGARVLHVLIAAAPVHGHRYAFAYQVDGAWQRLEQTYIAPAATVTPSVYVAPGGYRYQYYPYQPRFAVPPPGARYPYVYRAW